MSKSRIIVIEHKHSIRKRCKPITGFSTYAWIINNLRWLEDFVHQSLTLCKRTADLYLKSVIRHHHIFLSRKDIIMAVYYRWIVCSLSFMNRSIFFFLHLHQARICVFIIYYCYFQAISYLCHEYCTLNHLQINSSICLFICPAYMLTFLFMLGFEGEMSILPTYKRPQGEFYWIWHMLNLYHWW